MKMYPGNVIQKTFPDTSIDDNLSVSMAEIKSHLRVDFTAADSQIRDFVASAQEYFQEYCNISLAERVLIYRVQGFYHKRGSFSNGFWLPYPPIVSIEAVTRRDSDGNATNLTTSIDYNTRDQHSGDKSLVIENLMEMEEYEIEYRAGYGDVANIPQRMKQAIKLLVGSWYNAREHLMLTGAVPKEIPTTFRSLAAMCKHFPGT